MKIQCYILEDKKLKANKYSKPGWLQWPKVNIFWNQIGKSTAHFDKTVEKQILEVKFERNANLFKFL